MKIIFYSTGCPRCKVLKKKLDDKHIEYQTVSDIDAISNEGITTVPVLEVDNVKMDFKTAVDWINTKGE